MNLLVVAGIVFIVFTIGEFAARFVGSYRSRPFRGKAEEAAEKSRVDVLLEEYALSKVGHLAMKPGDFDEGQAIVDKENVRAGLLQRAYHEAIARCMWSVGFALVLLCVSVTVLKDNPTFQAFATVVDLLVIIYALAFVVTARYVNRMWIRQRALGELLRTWLHLGIVFQLSRGDGSSTALSGMQEVADGVRAEVTGGNTTLSIFRLLVQPTGKGQSVAFRDLHRRIEQHWLDLKARCANGVRKQLEYGRTAFYVLERPVYQLSYFVGAQERLHIFHVSRGRQMVALYVLSAIFAVFDATIVFKGELPVSFATALDKIPNGILDWNALILLLGLILSAILTSLYVARNDRSLAHRYHAQERRIRQWLSIHGILFLTPSHLPAEDQAITRSILAFEEIMVEELLDWIQITSRDVVEVGG